MATSGYGAAADHQALTGLTVGDPHTQYASWTQGTLAARPVQPVRKGSQFLATDTGIMYVSDGGQWLVLQRPGAQLQGLANARPTPVVAGQDALYWATDAQVLYLSDGAAWFPVTAQPAKFQFARLFLAGS